MAKLVVNYTDGSSDLVVTDDGSWTYYNDGAVRLASLFQGERYGATKAAVEAGLIAGYDDSAWTASSRSRQKTVADCQLVSRHDDPVHVIPHQRCKKESLGETKRDPVPIFMIWVKMYPGVPVITIPEEYTKPGDETVTVRFAEILYPELEEYTNQKRRRNADGGELPYSNGN